MPFVRIRKLKPDLIFRVYEEQFASILRSLVLIF